MSGDVVVVTGEPLWPSVHGGRIRAARMVQELARHLDVIVAAPLEGEPADGLAVEGLPTEPVPRTVAVSRLPRLGRLLLGPRRVEIVRRLVDRARPEAVLFTHSYLAAMVPGLPARVVVDFQDVELRRMVMFARSGPWRARAAYGWEAAKARRWEPAVTRRATMVTASCERDLEVLASWNANAVLVPNGADPCGFGRSPAAGPVTLVASFGYRPNRDAARFVVEEVWPIVRRAEPRMRLRLVGRGAAGALAPTPEADGIEVIPDPEAVDRWYAEASVLLAPVAAGGGAQLKVTEALARGRTLVATRFSAASVPEPARGAVTVAAGAAEFAERVLDAWRDVPGRWRREAVLEGDVVPTWAEACEPLVGALAGAR